MRNKIKTKNLISSQTLFTQSHSSWLTLLAKIRSIFICISIIISRAILLTILIVTKLVLCSQVSIVFKMNLTSIWHISVTIILYLQSRSPSFVEENWSILITFLDLMECLVYITTTWEFLSLVTRQEALSIITTATLSLALITKRKMLASWRPTTSNPSGADGIVLQSCDRTNILCNR